MGKSETKYIYPRIERLSLLYLQYIDDIFMTWNGRKDQLRKFIEELNMVHTTIKFDFEIHSREINFFDTAVYKDIDGKLMTKIYRIPTNRQNLIHVKSEHPLTLNKSISYNQALRTRKICNKNNDFEENCAQLVEIFQTRGCKKNSTEKKTTKVVEIPRRDLLKRNARKPSIPIPIVTIYNRILPSLSKTSNKQWNFLQN